jgi:hypothetical protein
MGIGQSGRKASKRPWLRRTATGTSMSRIQTEEPIIQGGIDVVQRRSGMAMMVESVTGVTGATFGVHAKKLKTARAGMVGAGVTSSGKKAAVKGALTKIEREIVTAGRTRMTAIYVGAKVQNEMQGLRRH